MAAKNHCVTRVRPWKSDGALRSDVEPNGRGFGDDDPWMRKLHADRPTISARWTTCLTRVRVPVVCLWPAFPFPERPLLSIAVTSEPADKPARDAAHATVLRRVEATM